MFVSSTEEGEKWKRGEERREGRGREGVERKEKEKEKKRWRRRSEGEEREEEKEVGGKEDRKK